MAPGAVGRSAEDHGAAAHLRELGWAGLASAGQLQRIFWRRRRSRNGSKCTETRTGRYSPAAMVSICKGASLTTYLKGVDNGWGSDTTRDAQRAPPRRAFCPTRRAGVAIGPHGMDQGLSRSRESHPQSHARRAGHHDRLRGARRWPYVLATTPRAKRWRSPAPWPPSCSSRRPPSDADLFLILRVFDPDNNEVTFMGSTDPHTPIANGWLRASHRALDPERTTASTARTIPTTASTRLSRARRSNAMWSSLPPASWCRSGWRVATHRTWKGLRVRRASSVISGSSSTTPAEAPAV